MTDKEIKSKYDEDRDEEVTGKYCPRCGNPTVREYDLEVCYFCGWSEADEEDKSDT